MSIKRILFTVILTLTLVGLFPVPSNAAHAWYYVTIKSIGTSGNGSNYILVSDNAGSFTNKWFVFSADQAQANRQLAVALSAMANSSPVAIYADAAEPNDNNRNIVNMYVFAEQI
jgi:hypothetical protein